MNLNDDQNVLSLYLDLMMLAFLDEGALLPFVCMSLIYIVG
jgi:hypothetical protein